METIAFRSPSIMSRFFRFFLVTIDAYAAGMAEYRKMNVPRLENERNFSVSLRNFESLRQATVDELVEMKEDIRHRWFLSAFKECCDVWHSVVVAVVVTCLPLNILIRPLIWYFVFFAAGVVTPLKHGRRFSEHRCIRSRRNCASGGHRCANSSLSAIE